MFRTRERTATVASQRWRGPHRVAAAGIALLSLALAAEAGAALATHSTSTIGLLAIDAGAEGNTATSLGPVNGCTRIEPGAEIAVDYVVDSVPQDRPMIGFEAQVRYDSELLEVAAADYNFLLAAVGAHTPFTGQSDQVPDSDGSFRMQVLDTASMTDPEANVEMGPGVLARLTLRAKTAGLAALSITVTREPLVYPTVLDTQNELIFVDRVGSASLAIGQDCPVEVQQPVITDVTEVNEQILADNPGLAGATTPAGGATTDSGTGAPSAGLSPGDGTPPGSPSAPSPTTVPCAAPPRPTPTASPSPSPLPEGDAPSPTDTPTPAPTPTAVICTPTPTPVQEQIVDVEEDSNTLPILGAAALLTAGTAAAGGGWYIYRRSRDTSPGA
jgi:Cohesin domain